MSFKLFTPTRTLTLAGCLLALLALLACTPYIRDPHVAMLAQAGANLTPTAAPVAQAAPQVVIDNFTFTPDVITVTTGTTVTWRNQDDTPHTVTEANRLFGSNALDTDDQFAFRFTATGVYTYFCSIHPMMIGHVVVK